MKNREIKINGMDDTLKVQRTKQLLDAFQDYLKSDYESLDDVYGRSSSEKKDAFKDINKLYYENDVVDYTRIIRFCRNTFSMGCVIKQEDKYYFIYDTRDYRKCLDVTSYYENV